MNRSLSSQARAQAWQLWLDTVAAEPGAAAKLAPAVLAAASARLAAGDPDPRLVLVLGRAALAARRWDAAAREVLLRLGASEDPALAEEARAARRGVVRIDAVLRTYSPSRLAWYREAFAAGSLSAAMLLAIAALRGGRATGADPQDAQAVRFCLDRLSASQWRALGQSPEAARAWLAEWYSRPDVADTSPEALALIREVVRADPRNPRLLAFLAAALRPRTDGPAVEVYEALFALAPEDRDNTAALAEAHLSGAASLRAAEAVLSSYAQLEPQAAERVTGALAELAVAAERSDDQALAWLEAAAAQPEAKPTTRGWLAVAWARRGRADPAAQDLWRAIFEDPAVPSAWRGEAGLALLVALREAGTIDHELAERVWHALPAERRPDGLALALAEHLVAQERDDAATASIYRRAYELNPHPELARLLSRAYLVDDATPVRTKIEHWKAALERRAAEPEVVAALARAYVPLGSVTEAAVDVAESAPPAQRLRLLDDLCRYRFRRADFAAAEALAAALARAVPPEDPVGAAEVQAKLLVCKVRRALTEGRDLRLIDAGPARVALTTLDPASPTAQRLSQLLALVATAAGEVQPADLAPVLEATAARAEAAPATAGGAGGSAASSSVGAALRAAAARLTGQPGPTEVPETREPPEVWLLALVAHQEGREEDAEALLARLPRPLAAAGRALFGDLPDETPSQRLDRRLAVVHRPGPPWAGLAAATLDQALRGGTANQVEPLAELFDEPQALAAELRLIAELEASDPTAAAVRADRLETATDPDLSWMLGDSLAARAIQRDLDQGRLAAAEKAVTAYHTRLTEPPERPTPSRAAVDEEHWLRAQSTIARGAPAQAWDQLARLSPQARARPALAVASAAWHLAEGQPTRAEGELSQALDATPDHPELLYATLSLAASLGRSETFLRLAGPTLAQLPPDDPRRDGLALVERLLSGELAEVRLDDWFARPGELSDEQLIWRLRCAQAVAAALLRARRPAEAAAQLRACVAALRGEKRAGLADTLAEVHNLRAYAHYLCAEPAEATRLLGRMTGARLALGHNLARVAVEAGESSRAVDLWTQLTPDFEALPLDEVAPGYRAAALLAWRLNLAELLLAREQWREALEHLEACLRERPLDVELQRKIIPALIAVGDGEVALYKSDWLIKERPNDLEILLEHGMVLASVRGTKAGLDWYDDLLRRRPDTADAIRHRKRELRDRIAQRSAELARSGDYVGLFALSRELEGLVENDEERARAMLQQAYALHNMSEADPDQRGAVLEQALSRIEEALALAPGDKLLGQLQQLRAALGPALAPELTRNALDLLRHRRREWLTLSEQTTARQPADREQVEALEAAFQRIATLLERAEDLGGTPLTNIAAEGLGEARRLSAECRQLAERLRAGGR